jgi:hypothetical protein
VASFTEVLVASLVTVTSTPGMAAPVESVTLPMMDALSTCALAEKATARRINTVEAPNLGIA